MLINSVVFDLYVYIYHILVLGIAKHNGDEPPTKKKIFMQMQVALNTYGHLKLGGTRWQSLFRHCATSQKVMGSIPDSVNGIFIDINLPAALWP